MSVSRRNRNNNPFHDPGKKYTEMVAVRLSFEEKAALIALATEADAYPSTVAAGLVVSALKASGYIAQPSAPGPTSQGDA